MKIKIELFSVYREAIGEKEIEIKDDAKIKDIIQFLTKKYPSIRKFIGYAIFSINHEYADENRSVKGGDEIAIFPPIGGS
ncbi:MAG: MoaD/ThiS family protein [Thermoplasmata archaeon]|nr:MoaD/ThiS family protein [Thermoplasmata archaeon]